ncbi:RND family transporter [Candidatus Mycobacterium wuenschmannii]|uniref:RND family transporter n=1 Tax=Candidatus Mycobacterium wuenschmannii TaxID=3027808 RepID=A0ABY8W2S0_9MYCO|nr:RND family transporter [Candidatus Mycobacterium wuenschmannii]WIM88718.1 RND family transporter [Candidatus Mycobacterium wuenschmannii]
MSPRTDVIDPPAATGVYPKLGRVVTRHPFMVIALWLALAAGVSLGLPPLAVVIGQKQAQIMPDDAPMMVAAREMVAAFHDKGTDNVVLAVLTDDKDLSPADEATYRTLVEKLRQDTADVVSLQDFLGSPEVREVLSSKDKKAWYLPIALAGHAGSAEGGVAFQNASKLIKQTVSGSTLTAHLAGPAATAADLTMISERDMHVIEIGTGIMVLLILLIVYRNPLTLLMPLITIGISLVTAQGVLAGLALLGLGVSAQTMVFMSGIVYGAGTDYAVFLISRYHDYVRLGEDSDQAIRHALGSIGKVIAASAATVAVTFVAMVFTKLPVFSTVGPALAIAVTVAFLAAVTVLPAIMTLAGRRGWIKPRRELTTRFWRTSGVRIVRRPRIHLVASLLILITLAVCSGYAHYNYDDRKTLPSSVESAAGYDVMAQHFPLDTIIPQYLFIQSPRDMRDPKMLADLEQMAQRVSQLSNVAMVRGITRPTGESLEQARLAWQAGEVGNKLGDASQQINGHTGDLDTMTDGANQLANALGDLRSQVDQALPNITGLVDSLTFLQKNFGGQKVLNQLDDAAKLITDMHKLGQNLDLNIVDVNNVASLARPILNALDATPVCSLDPNCVTARAQLQRIADAHESGELTSVAELSKKLESAQGTDTLGATTDKLKQLVNQLNSATQVLGGGGLSAKLAYLQNGANQLADGSRKLADAVALLVGQTKEMGAGLNDASGFLMAMKNGANAPPMAGFFIPPQVLTRDDFKKAAGIFVSPDGHAARYLVQTKLNPFSIAAMDQVNSILDTARQAQPNTTLADARVSMAGISVGLRDTRDYYNKDFNFIIITTVVIVFLILIGLLRAIVAPLYLICSVILSYLSALGIGTIVFQFGLHQELHWTVPGLTFIILVAVGADYNLLLISRIRDESTHGIRVGVIRTVGATGGVITAAGLIFAASMFGLLFASITMMVQAGFVLGTGILLDTFLVRTVTVPAIATLVGKGNWWPSRSHSRKRLARPRRSRLARLRSRVTPTFAAKRRLAKQLAAEAPDEAPDVPETDETSIPPAENRRATEPPRAVVAVALNRRVGGRLDR